MKCHACGFEIVGTNALCPICGHDALAIGGPPADEALRNHPERFNDPIYSEYVKAATSDPHTGSCRCTRCQGIIWGLKYLLWYDNGSGWYDPFSYHPSLDDAILASERGWQTPVRITTIDGDANAVIGTIEKY